MENHAAGISIIAFIVAVGVSIGYYQFVYLPQANAKPILPAEVLNPPQTTKISISPGSSQPSQTKNFVPKEGDATLGATNKVVWTNHDNGYKDLINGQFNSISSIGLVLPQKTYQFTFTTDGTYPYHCEPHPWMTGKIVIAKGKF
jgi:plastocyanin